ncbi:anti-sigma B factor RsbW [Paenibacillus sp. LMG 31461]|uniref:Anti-sigma B factor RsbW n=1 Tax=Paenibacillus plantarum TaxID=2654975 RepID=A0ABX1X6Z7_9BACL|nr:anti-sigma B factor RsbW [Paenibacillus plantarum]NOU64197.1 anti-sigma B factor RsbW [Paenibacillus plantarum]
MKVIRLHIPAAAEHLEIVRLSLYGVATKLGFSYEDIEDMKVAVSEACNNAILHANPEDGSGHIDISYELSDDALRVKVKDNGTGYEAASESRQTGPFTGTMPSELTTGGLGIYLMEALMDEVLVDTTGGTEVTLVKYVHSKNHGMTE